MERDKRGSHTVWDCKYQIVWVTMSRYQVLGGNVGMRCRELVRETARAHEMLIHARSVNRDHVHSLLSIPPNLSVSRAVQRQKGRSSHKLPSEFKSMRKCYWRQHLWARGYWVRPRSSHRSSRRLTVWKAPKSGGRSLHLAPKRAIQRSALMKLIKPLGKMRPVNLMVMGVMA